MSLTLKTTNVEEIQKKHYSIDSHTVSLKDRGTWFALVDEKGEFLSMLCIRQQNKELYIGEAFTPKEFRGKGYFTELCKMVVDDLFPKYSISTHALITSKNCFERCGFEQYAFRHFKYGDQYWLRRKGEKL